MKITVNIIYSGTNNSAYLFAKEMIESGTVTDIKSQEGNIKYGYYLPMDNPNELLLVDEWVSQEAIDLHHKSPMMKKIADLRKKYNLKMKVKRYTEIS
ncbi:antibiotic biosynthesis monooxygenase family protein [Apilactobacillus kunkeei]|uniref:antibiotic biosynthesis monooxygenase family protein n=1 Tax=Apilactobacillus kunkeei TaxID=148814 RepID=UPI001C8A3F0A|nr:putative quinol monooxygenase [Apilactobacillus kunkeei]MBX8456262.1 antibiotic biosynthesis monooxygenase [Apilactobacillus kunkeei]